MNISIGILPLAEDKKTKLKENGFLFVQDAFGNDAKDILRNVDDEEMTELQSKPIVQSALTLWKAEMSRRRIVTFSKELDLLLGGGIELQAITDLCGAPGTGKTQLCHQLCIDVQLPTDQGGINGQSIYIDTNHSFSRRRIEDMAEACVQHCQWVQEQKGVTQPVPTVEDLLAGVQVCRTPVGTLEELLAVLTNLKDVINPKIRLVVIDSFSKPLLLYCENLKTRTALINEILSNLQSLAWEFNLAIVTTSQLTTHLRADKEARVIPGMGQGFAHRVTHRVLLGIIDDPSMTVRHAAQMYKSSSRPSDSAYFQILKSGIRDEGVDV